MYIKIKDNSIVSLFPKILLIPDIPTRTFLDTYKIGSIENIKIKIDFYQLSQ